MANSPKAQIIIKDNLQSPYLISPYGYPKKKYMPSWDKIIKILVKKAQEYPRSFPPSYLSKYDLTSYSPNEIFTMFDEDPTKLAVKYANGEQMSPFELDRIKFEGTPDTVQILSQLVGGQDFLLQKLAKTWNMSLKIGLFMI